MVVSFARRRLSTPLVLTLGASLALGLGLGADPADPAAAATRPDKITKVWVTKDKVGTFTVHWSAKGHHTTGFAIETGLTSFSKTDKSMPSSGRHAHTFKVGRKSRSFTFTDAQLRVAGAQLGSGNHLYFRLAALNGKTKRFWPYLQAQMPKSAAPAGATLRVGSFNVRTARATGDKRSWLQRSGDVATAINSHNLGLVAIQELNVGRADGRAGTTNGAPRQTDSLLTALAKVGGSRYKLVRTTPYVLAGTEQGTQGMRILYDSTRFRLDSSCPETTAGHAYSGSCSFAMPLLKGDKESLRRRAAYARFTDLRTHKSFFFVSVHLDERHTGSAATQRRQDGLRGTQIKSVSDTVSRLNTSKLPVIIAGDFNSWQNYRAGNSPHDALISRGYADSVAATTQVNLKYPTLNNFDTTLKPGAQGFAPRLDMIVSRGLHGAKRFENVMKVSDTKRPSDHNLILTDLVY